MNENDTYIQNPGFPTAYGETASVTYTVNKVQDGKKNIIKPRKNTIF